jgi:hypothetical protein
VAVVDESAFLLLVQAVIADDAPSVERMLATSPSLARAQAARGATRQEAEPFYFGEIGHYLYVGDSALHIAAAGYRTGLVGTLVAAGSDVRARNRRGAEPLHYAADGAPGSKRWDADAQAATIAALIAAGADPNATDKSGVAPLHRAVRTRCADAVRALLEGGADGRLANKSGSTPMKLATQSTGRGGSGSPEAKSQQEEIVRLLIRHGAGEERPEPDGVDG